MKYSYVRWIVIIKIITSVNDPKRTQDEYDDDYEFFERLVEMHSEYSRENLLKHMKGWPKQEELKKLSKEDLVLTFSEGIMANIKKPA